MCQTCHAIGGAGGKIGPDLSSLGTSSPIDNIIQSLLAPSESIKEGFELQRVVKKDGSAVMGYLAGDGASALVIRNVAGIEESIPKSQIDVHESVPGSLMPPGLTAGLDKKEFVDLVGYLSKLGQSGDFRVPNSLFVRRWRAINGNKDWQAKVKQEGLNHLIKADAKNSLLPVYSKVSGALPLDELSTFEANNGKFSALQFEIEVLTEGTVALSFDSTEGISAWADQKPLTITQNGAVATLPKGIHTFILAVDRTVRKDGQLSVHLQDAASSPAQVRLVMGQ